MFKKPLKPGDFKLILGSKIWPSDDPKDSPHDDYVCIYCGFKINFKDCGTWYEGERETEVNRIKNQTDRHRDVCKKWPFIIEEIGYGKKIDKACTVVTISFSGQPGSALAL